MKDYSTRVMIVDNFEKWVEWDINSLRNYLKDQNSESIEAQFYEMAIIECENELNSYLLNKESFEKFRISLNKEDDKFEETKDKSINSDLLFAFYEYSKSVNENATNLYNIKLRNDEEINKLKMNKGFYYSY